MYCKQETQITGKNKYTCISKKLHSTATEFQIKEIKFLHGFTDKCKKKLYVFHVITQ